MATESRTEALVRDEKWFADDCQCSTRSPDGDGCYLTADYTTGLCFHCQGHAIERQAGDARVLAVPDDGLRALMEAADHEKVTEDARVKRYPRTEFVNTTARAEFTAAAERYVRAALSASPTETP